MKCRIVFHQVPSSLHRYRRGRTRHLQTELDADRYDGADVHILRGWGESLRGHRHVIGIEWHVWNAEISGRIRGRRAVKVADRIMNFDRRVGHDGARGIEDVPLIEPELPPDWARAARVRSALLRKVTAKMAMKRHL